MWKNRRENLKLQMWYSRSSSCKKEFFMCFVFLIISLVLVFNGINPICFLILYMMAQMFFTNIFEMSLSDMSLACTPLSFVDTIWSLSIITWVKATIIVLVSLVMAMLGILFKFTEINFWYLIDAFKYPIIAYPLLIFLFTFKYFVPSKYKKIASVLIIYILLSICFGISLLPMFWNLFSTIIIVVMLCTINHVLFKKLNYEIIFLRS